MRIQTENTMTDIQLKYGIIDMDLQGDKFRRMYIREPMTVHEIYAVMDELNFTEEDEVFYSVGIDREHGCVPLKMI